MRRASTRAASPGSAGGSCSPRPHSRSTRSCASTRWEPPRAASATQSGGVAAQDLDEKRSALTQAQTTLASAESNVLLSEAEVKRLTTLQEFEVVSAPFAGIITARGFDVGALVGPSGPSASTA